MRGACTRDAFVGARSAGDEFVQRLTALIARTAGSHENLPRPSNPAFLPRQRGGTFVANHSGTGRSLLVRQNDLWTQPHAVDTHSGRRFAAGVS